LYPPDGDFTASVDRAAALVHIGVGV